MRFVTTTSNPTLRAVFFEDFSALLGLLLAGVGIVLHQLTGIAAFDAIGSIADRRAAGVRGGLPDAPQHAVPRWGRGSARDCGDRVLTSLLEHPAIERITYLHVEYVGPSKLFVVAAVDLTGDDAEPDLAVRLRGLEDEVEDDDLIEDAIFTLSLPDEPSLAPGDAGPATT